MDRTDINLREWITTAEAARILGLTARRVRQLANVEDKIESRMVTPRLMLVKRADVERYKASM